jgi:electron-transferring-flavoprotein dehydrogenase
MAGINQIDVLFIGAGPAGLAGAIRTKQLLNQAGRTESVAVIEKSEKVGQHILSGLVFEPQALDELIPNWREKDDPFVTKALGNLVQKDEAILLPNRSAAIKLPHSIVPAYMRNKGKIILSGSEMVRWLTKEAEALGVKIYPGFSATEVLYDGSRVKGVRLGERGLDREGGHQVNYVPSESIEAKVTVFGEGSLGQLAEDVIKRNGLGRNRNHQIRSVGVKEIIKLPSDSEFGANHVIHTFGYPLPGVFGGGTLYSLDKNTVAVALVLGLDWKYADLSPHQELQLFKSHKYIRRLLDGGETVAYGAKTLPEGGYFSLPQPYTDGALIVGDAAGFTDVRKLKGWHNAMRSGTLAGEAIAKAIERDDFSATSLKTYDDLLQASPVIADLEKGKNYRQVFSKGRSVYIGAPLSVLQGLIPGRIKTEPDYESLTRARLNRKHEGGLDRLTGVALSGTIHREEEPPHITISDPGKCAGCVGKYGVNPCVYFCPAEVYCLADGELTINASNCLHCQTCRTKCPEQVIQWRVPEGGEGPKYKVM